AGHRAIFGNAELVQSDPAAPATAVAPKRGAGPRAGGKAGGRRGNLPPVASPLQPVIVEAVSEQPEKDAGPLLHNFVTRVYRRPVAADEEATFQKIIQGALKAGHSFNDAML